MRANFGRFSIAICNDVGNTDWSVNCLQPRTLRVVNARCQAKPRCEIPVLASTFGDACPGTNKYVEVHYTCRPVASAQTTPKPLPPWLLDLAATPATTSTTSTTAPTTSSSEKAETPTTVRSSTVKTTVFPETTSSEDVSLPGVTSSEDSLSESDIEVLEELVGHCPPQTSRNLFWNWTQSGQEAIQVCPPGSNGFARWTCGDDGEWTTELPNLSECQSLWLSRLESRMHATTAIGSVSAELAAHSEAKILYGGDLPIVATIVQGLAHKLRRDLYVIPSQDEKEVKIAELLQNVLKTASNLLDESQFLAWRELQREKRAGVATALLLGLEENALLLAETLNNEKNFVEATNNILASLRVMRARDIADQPFPNHSEADSRVIVPASSLMETSVNGAVRIVFFLYNNLEGILPGSGTHFVNSKVLGAVVSKGHTQTLQHPVLFTLRHLQSENVRNPVCAAWDYAHRAWTDKDCSMLKTNATHTVCQCKRVSLYSVLMEERPSAVPHAAADANRHDSVIVDASEGGRDRQNVSTIVTSVVAIVLSVVILVVVLLLIKRFDIKPRVQKFVAANSAGGGIFRCKKSESTTSSCGFYPPLTSSPTSTTVSSGTPTNQTYLEQVLKAHNADYMQQQQQNNNGVTSPGQPVAGQPTVIYGRTASVPGPQQPPPRHLVALNQYDPFGHHIYMEIDPVYAHLEAGGEHHAAHSDIQLSDISDDGDLMRNARNHGQQQRFAEERPLIRSHHQLNGGYYPGGGQQQPGNPQNLHRQCMTTQRLLSRLPPGMPMDGSLRLVRSSARVADGSAMTAAVPRNLEAPITIALQGGEQFVSLKIDQDRRELQRQRAAAAAARAEKLQQQQQQTDNSAGIYR